MTDRIPCPACGGSGRGDSVVHLDFADGHAETRTGVCGTCSGLGEIEPTRAEWVEAGTRHRQERVERREGIRACAERYGVSAVLLSLAERGLAELPEQDDA